MDHSEEVLSVVFPARDEPSRVVQPGKESLDLPAAAVAAQRTTVLRGGIHAAHVVGSDQLDAVAVAQLLIQSLTVVGPVDDRHDFTAFSSASRADSRAPFFALLKLASMKVSDRSILPRSRKSSASAVSTPVRGPS